MSEATRDPKTAGQSAFSNIVVAILAGIMTLFIPEGWSAQLKEVFPPEVVTGLAGSFVLSVQQFSALIGSSLRDAQFFDPDRHKQGTLRDVLSTLGAKWLG